LKAGPNT